MTQWITICKTSEILPGEYRCASLGNLLIAVFNVDGQYYAIEDVCTHDGGELTGGCVDGFIVECPRHGAQFDVRNGQVVAPPACVPLRTFSVLLKDGMVWVEDKF